MSFPPDSLSGPFSNEAGYRTSSCGVLNPNASRGMGPGGASTITQSNRAVVFRSTAVLEVLAASDSPRRP
jgi:hypothetical protein